MVPSKQTALLAIETSCDETAVAVLKKSGAEIEVLAAAVASQIDIHKETGGVVPEVAAREHAAVIQPLIKKVVGESGIEPADINAVAVTVGPGLAPALAVGVTAAQTLAFVWHKPIVPVHHLEGHIYSALFQSAEMTNFQFSIPNEQSIFPALALIVSGGHTQLIYMTGHFNYQVIGSTRDDAVGEAFDKVARLLELGYPGGPAISRLAKEGDPAAFSFARPMLRSGDLDFSFSGLKTEVLYTLRKLQAASPRGALERSGDMAASFQQAAVESLTNKTVQAAAKLNPKVVLLAGGVAANQLLRAELKKEMQTLGLSLSTAPPSLCGDNAIMIGLAGMFAFEAGRTANWDEVDAQARLGIESMDNPVA